MWFRRLNQRRDPPLTAAFDRGEAKYFHGKMQILEDFQKLVERSDLAKSGTTFLIQGSPDVGKTARLAECAKHARSEEWRVAKIRAVNLWNSDLLHSALNLKKENLDGTTLTGEIPRLAKKEVRQRSLSDSPETVIQECSGAVLLILDEAFPFNGLQIPPPKARMHPIRP